MLDDPQRAARVAAAEIRPRRGFAAVTVVALDVPGSGVDVLVVAAA